MTSDFTMTFCWPPSDTRWLADLLAAVPLAEGRMEIRPNWLVILFRCGMFAGLAGISWLFTIFEVKGWELGLGYAALVTGGVFALVTTLGVVEYGRRVVRVMTRKPDFVLSPLGLSTDGVLLPWGEIKDIKYVVRPLFNYQSAHRCHLHLVDGKTRKLELDHLTISHRRVMMLIDFYWSGAKAETADRQCDQPDATGD